MRAAIRSLHSPDIADPESWQPALADDFAFLLQIMAGPAGGVGEESFEVVVCTPAWLARRCGPDGIVSGRHHLIVGCYDWSRIRAHVEKIVDEAEGNSWSDVAVQLAAFGRWEFEGYREHSGPHD